jgi:hypothetical protein
MWRRNMQFTKRFSSIILILASTTALATNPGITSQDNLFEYHASVQVQQGDMTIVRWQVTNRTGTALDLRSFNVAYQCGDEFVDVLEHEYRGFIQPGKTTELPGDYYVCIRHKGIKQHNVTKVNFSQPGMPTANSLHCANGNKITFAIEPIKQHGYRLIMQNGNIITLSDNNLDDKKLAAALCNGSIVKEPGVVNSLVKWLREKNQNDKGKPAKSTAIGTRG